MTNGHRIEVRLLVELRRTADMEGTHGKLRARLTNGLRCDDAYGFTDVDRRTASKITTIAFAAHAHLRLADQRRADPRSEEHTSELQSLMRNSYAVFCLKNKKYNRYS